MILLEGSDRVGKTTVAKALRDLLPGWSYRHHTKPPCDTYDYFARFLTETHPRVIVDRFHWSNYTYGHVYGDQSRLTPHQVRVLDLGYLSRRAVVIFLYDSIGNIKSRWSADEMYRWDQDRWETLIGRYNSLVDGQILDGYVNRLPVIQATLPDLWDLQTNKPTEFLCTIAKAAEYHTDQLDGFPSASLGYGSTTHGGFVVVGEKPSYAKFDSPNFPLDMGPACQLLWDSLDEIRLRWWEGYYTNASAWRTPEQFAGLINRLQPKKVLSLGSVASNFVCKATLCGTWPHTEVDSVTHPGFVRRFESDKVSFWRRGLAYKLKHWCGDNQSPREAAPPDDES